MKSYWCCTTQSVLSCEFFKLIFRMDKTTDALKAVTEYSQKHGISELSKGNLLKTQAVLMVRGKRINVMSAVKLLKQAGAWFYSVGCKKGLALCKFALAKTYSEWWNDLLEAMPEKTEDMLYEASLNFVQNALKLFKQISWIRGQYYCEKLEDLLKKKMNTQDRGFRSTRYYVELTKNVQKELGEIKPNSWIGEEHLLILGKYFMHNYLELALEDYSHLPANEQQLIKKVNGTLVNIKNKKENTRNVRLKY